MRASFLFIATVLFALSAVKSHAALADVEIKVNREKLDHESGTRGNKRIENKEVIYNITVQSKTFKQLSNLEAKYMIFYYDSEPGSPDKPEEKSIVGSEKIIALAGNRAVSFKTSPIVLTTVTLDGGWYYSGGGKNQSKDRVSGVWVKVIADGVLVGEYASPSSITKRTWKD